VPTAIHYNQRMLDLLENFRYMTLRKTDKDYTVDTDLWSSFNGGSDIMISLQMIVFWWLFLFLVAEGYCCFCCRRKKELILKDLDEDKEEKLGATVIKEADLMPKVDKMNVDDNFSIRSKSRISMTASKIDADKLSYKSSKTQNFDKSSVKHKASNFFGESPQSALKPKRFGSFISGKRGSADEGYGMRQVASQNYKFNTATGEVELQKRDDQGD
jgi:hypothetical protein